MNDLLDPERWTHVVALFDEAVSLPAGERASFLDRRCGGDAGLRREVDSLLESDRPDGDAFASGVRRAVGDAAASVQQGRLPFERLGAYRLVAEIGRGGMGVVYLAERDDDVRQPVAIKLAHATARGDLLNRFRAEREILASLQHPGIAQLIDGGTTPGGIPYLVMERVEGVPITDYCSAHALGLHRRLELFRRVCDAVSHAHRRLIVHRDIKPSNIVVTIDGTPKLLDFGIAKLLGPDAASALLTGPAMRLLTPEYASPEQIRGESITTATDVYSLGGLLFELLTGTRPRQFTSRRYEEIAQAITTTAVSRPSTAVERGSRRARELTGDLDTIVMTALDAEPGRRYPSVDRLSDDVQRFLESRPVLAQAATWRYRAGRFVTRHRASVTVASAFALIVVTLAGMLAVSIRRGERERDAANRVSAILLETFEGPSPRAGAAAGRSTVTAERLDYGMARVRRDLGDEPALQARLFDALGAIYGGLGLTEQAYAALRDAMAARAAAGAGDSQETARTMWRLADALRERAQYPAAEHMARGAVDMQTRLVGRRNPQTAQALNSLGMALVALGRRDEAEPMFAEAADIFRETLGRDHPTVTAALLNLAAAQRDRGDLAHAERTARDALALRARTFGAALGESLDLLADVLDSEGRTAEAAPLRVEADRQRSGRAR